MTGTWAPPAEAVMTALTDLVPPNEAHRPGGAASWVMMWTLGGAGLITQGEAVIRAEPGTLVVLGSQTAHRYGVDPGQRHWVNWWAHFQPRASWLALLRPFRVGTRAYAVGPVPAVARAAVGDAWRRLHAYLRWSGGALPPRPRRSATSNRAVLVSDPRRCALGRTVLEEIVALATTAAAPTTTADNSVDARVRRVLTHIAADPGAPHTVRSLAEVAALSPSRLTHLFSETVGRSPMQAVRAARLDYAARLLTGTDLTVAQVAQASGFASPFHFSRTFAGVYGVAPSAYRDSTDGHALSS
jgi:AraC family transcriptional regulator, arabinose operon regulatory protein